MLNRIILAITFFLSFSFFGAISTEAEGLPIWKTALYKASTEGKIQADIFEEILVQLNDGQAPTPKDISKLVQQEKILEAAIKDLIQEIKHEKERLLFITTSACKQVEAEICKKEKASLQVFYTEIEKSKDYTLSIIWLLEQTQGFIDSLSI